LFRLKQIDLTRHSEACCLVPIRQSQSRALDDLAAYLSRKLFRGRDALPRVMVNVVRRARSTGHIKQQLSTDPKRDEVLVEINLNLEVLPNYRAVCSEICHQLVLVWQRSHGKPSRLGYHNYDWVDKMMKIGLMPSSTGQPDGEMTGQRMSHYPIEGGLFMQVFDSMPDDLFLVPIVYRRERPSSAKRLTYYCPCRPKNRCLAAPGFEATCRLCGGAFVVKVPKTRQWQATTD
jgi:hypothetical protein